MNLLLLPGNSIDNKDWIDGFSRFVKGIFDQIEVVHYDHWETGEAMGNLGKEVQKSLKIVENWDDYVIISKSFGCVVALNLFKIVKKKPREIVLIGFPMGFAKKVDSNFDILFDGVDCKLLFIQKPKDPACSYGNLKKYIDNLGLKNYKVVQYDNPKEPIDNHHYGSYEKVMEIIKMDSM